MAPKKPNELRKQIEQQKGQPSEPGHERTAEGMETRTPKRREFFRNLEKVARPLPDRDSSPDK